MSLVLTSFSDMILKHLFHNKPKHLQMIIFDLWRIITDTSSFHTHFHVSMNINTGLAQNICTACVCVCECGGGVCV